MFEIGVRWNDQSTVTANALPKLYTFGSTRTLEPNPDSKIHVRINSQVTSLNALPMTTLLVHQTDERQKYDCWLE